MARHFQKRLLMAIFNNDLSDVRATLRHVQETLGRVALDDLLTKRRRLAPMGQEHDPALLHVLTVMLLDNLPDLTPRHFAFPKLLLQTHVQAYRGLPIHVAVALRRLRIVEQLLDTASTYHLDISNQLRATDTCHNTALSLAARIGLQDTVVYLLARAKEGPTYCKFILRHCLAQNSRQLIYCDLALNGVIGVIFWQMWLFDKGSETHLSLFWHICKKHSYAVETLLKGVNMYSSRLQEPSPFHFTVSICSAGQLQKYDKCLDILHTLEHHREENGWTAPNDVSTLKIGNKTHFNGTAAHFALLNYRPSHLQKIHPGYDTGGTLDKNQNEMPQSFPFWNLLWIMDYLRDEHKVDLFKPNHEQKTPLDCLPPDAYPLLIYGLIASHNGWRQDCSA